MRAKSIFAVPAGLSDVDRQQRRHALVRLSLAWLAMMQVMMFAWPGYLRHDGIPTDALETLDWAIVLMNWASFALTVPVVLYSAWPIWRHAGDNLRHGRAGMDVPVALGIVAAFIPSVHATYTGHGEVYFDSVTMFVAFLLTARYLELCARQSYGGSAGGLRHSRVEARRLSLGASADRLASRFVMIQVLLALAAAAAWAYIDPAHSIPVMVALLVMSCPCAMSMAVPTAMARRTPRWRRIRPCPTHLAGAAGRGGPQGAPELAWLACMASADDAAGAGRLGHALAGGHHHAAVLAGGGLELLAAVAPRLVRRISRRRAGIRMTILYLLLPLSLFVLAIGVSLWWAVFNGQYDDTDSAGTAILRDDDSGPGSRGQAAAARCPRRGLRSAAADMSDPVGSRCF